jgi:predicted PurR-regulated permease PerM
VLAIFYTLYFARAFLVPIVFATLLNFLFSPAVRALGRLRLPAPIGALGIILALLGAFSFGARELSGPVRAWVAEAPTTLATTQRKLRGVLGPLERVERTAEQVQNSATSGPARTPQVVVQGPSMLSQLFGTTQRVVADLIEMVILLYFLLAAGDLFLQKLITVLPTRQEKTAAINIARKTEASISAYLGATAAVNIAEGVVVVVVMHLLNMPNAGLWGVLVALLEFIPYIGSVVIVAILATAGLTTFDSVGHALVVPGAYVLINVVQSNVVSPLVLGQRLSLNPVALFVGLAFWFWLWGVAGAFIAVPLLATLKICCDHIDSLAAVGEFLGQRNPRRRAPLPWRRNHSDAVLRDA